MKNLVHVIRRLGFGLVLVLACVSAPGATMIWTNTMGGNWAVPENWDPNQVPVPGDTAVITNDGSYTVTVDAGFVALEQLVLGGGAGIQTLSLVQGPFSCSGSITVNPNGVLVIACESVGAGQMAIAGQLNWEHGAIAAPVTIAAGAVLSITGDTEKWLNDFGSITNYGAIYWSGAGPITGRDDLAVPGAPALVNTIGGLLEINSDASLRVGMSDPFDPSHTFLLQNAGTMRKVGGPGVTLFENLRFENTGLVEIQQGTLRLVSSDPRHEQLVSSGQFAVAAGTAVELADGVCTFLPGHQALGEGYFGPRGGMPLLQGEVAGRLDWEGGGLYAFLVIGPNGVLNITGDTDKFLNEASITNYGTIRWSGTGAIVVNDDLAIPDIPALINMPGGVFEMLSDAPLRLNTGMYEPGHSFLFQNAGTLRKVGGLGVTTFENLRIENTGLVEIQQGTLRLVSYDPRHEQLVSSGQFAVAAGAAVELGDGVCTFLPGHQALGLGFFGVRGGMPLLQGELGGRLDWESGYLSGGLVIATNGLLNISGDTEKWLTEQATITNYGLIRWSGLGAIGGSDNPWLPAVPAIVNMPGGVFEILNDTSLRLAYGMSYDPNWTFLFQNRGILRKLGGPGVTTFDSVRFENTGLVEVPIGTLRLNSPDWQRQQLVSSGQFTVGAGAAVELGDGLCTFLPGHAALGEGFFGVRGGMPTLEGELAGRLDWESGYLSGGLVIATNGLLNISGDTEKWLTEQATITNYGLIRWSGLGTIGGVDDVWLPAIPAIVNMPGGVFEILNDTTLRLGVNVYYDPNWMFLFQNRGTLRKLGGPGVTTFENVRFENTGLVEVPIGTLRLNSPDWQRQQLVSSGQFTVGAGAAVELGDGLCTFLPGHQALGEGFFGVRGGWMPTLQGELAGRLDWEGGALFGGLVIGPDGVFNINGDQDKFLNDASITNYGTIRWSGQGAIQANDDPGMSAIPAIVNMAGGVFEILSDARLSFYPGNPSSIFLFHNAGTVRKLGGPGMTTFENVLFENTGLVDIQQGILQLWTPDRTRQQLVSSGQFTVAAGAAVELANGVCTLQPGHMALGDGFFGMRGGWMPTLQGELAGKLDWENGGLSGGLVIGPAGTLNISGDQEKYLSNASITNYGTIRWSGQGGISAFDDPGMPSAHAIINMPGGVFEILSDAWLSFNAGDPSSIFLFQNAGTVRKLGGPGMTVFLFIRFENTGLVDIQQGTLRLWTPDWSRQQLVSSGQFTIAAGAAVELADGVSTFLPGHMAVGDGFFGVRGGSMRVTLQGEFAGKLDWEDGSLSGGLVIGPNGLFNITGDMDKFLNDDASITNYGTIRWSGMGAIRGMDLPEIPEAPAFINMPGGVVEILSDALLSCYSGNPSAIFLFQNAGTVRKLGGPGMTTFENMFFENTGLVDIQQGTLRLVSPDRNHQQLVSSGQFTVAPGTAVELADGVSTFLPGHMALGDGFFGVRFGWTPVTLQGEFAGKLDWEGGYLSGRLVIGPNGLFNITGDMEKWPYGDTSLTNYGTIRWSGPGAIGVMDFPETPGAPVLINMPGGVFEILNDGWLSFYPGDPSSIFLFHNAGTVRKLGGPGMTTFENIFFENTGLVDIQQGTLRLTSWDPTRQELVSSGQFTIAAGAAVELADGVCTFQPGHMAVGDGFFGARGGAMPTLQGELAGKLDCEGGTFSGVLVIGPNGLLNLTGDMDKVLNDISLTNYGTIRWSGLGAIIGNDDLAIPATPAIINMPGSVFEILNDVPLRLNTGYSYEPGHNFLFQNAGTVRKLGGAGVTTFENLRFENTGMVDMQQGTLRLVSRDPAREQFVSAGVVEVGAGAAVELGDGTCTFQPGHQTLGDGFFGLRGGTSTTVQGEVNSRLEWENGGLSGELVIGTNGLLNLTGELGKVLNNDSVITNYGTIRWSGPGPIIGDDDVWTPEIPAIVNMAGGLFEIHNDARMFHLDTSIGLVDDFLFSNAGTVRKIAGEGTTAFDNLRFLNTGTFEVWQGTINIGDPVFCGASEWINTGTIVLAARSRTNYTRIHVFGTAELTGQLGLETLNGFLPAAGDSFELLTYNSTNVAFGSLDLPELPAGLYFVALADTNHLVVETRQQPIANPDAFTLNEDSPSDLDVLANDSYLYGGGAIAGFTQPAHGTVSLNTNNTLHYSPAPNYFGSDSFSYDAQNADGKLASGTVTLQVLPVNDPPVLGPIADQTVDEGALLTFQAVATDIEGDILMYWLSPAAPAGAVIDPLTGVFSWTPAESQGPGVYSVTITVTDNGTPNLSANQTFTVTVREVNRAPVLAAIADQTVRPAETFTLTFAASDPDLPANTLTFSLDAAPANASVTSDGVFTWTPGFDLAGTTNSVVVRVTDNGAPALSGSQSFAIVVVNSGLKADYFAGTNFDTLVLTRNDASVDNDWGNASPGNGVPADQFSVRWTGQLLPRYSETYTFITVSDDGVRLWIDGRLVINNWTIHLPSTNTGTITLSAGQSYSIKLEYFDNTNSAVCRLFWSSPSQPYELVPESQLACTGYSDVIPNAVYRLTPKLATSRCMEARNGWTADGTEVVLNNWGAKSQQKWQAVELGGGGFKLVPQHATSKVLEINGGSTTNGAPAQIATDTGAPYQRFRFIDMGQGWYKLQPQSAPGSVLEVSEGNKATPVLLNQDTGADGQRWRLDRQ